MNLKQLYQLFLKHPLVCTDTRKITSNCLFFALKGPNFNGNAFASEALEKGAAFAIIDEEEHKTSDKHILVDDVLETFQKLSTHHRNESKATIIGLTGSNGKTTTKELIYAVLSKKYRTIATQGNLNNHIGVPLTLLSIKEDTEMAVVEMGANHQKEIEFLSSIAQPDFGYITNFGKAHLEGFGGVEGVIKGKSELYDNLMSRDRHIFMNADDPIQLEKLESYTKKIGFSTDNNAYYIIKFLGAKPHVTLRVGDTVIQTQLIGDYNFPNCCVAVLMGKYFNIPEEDIKRALETYISENNRSQVIERNGFKVVLDAYNANPTSMRAALKNFKNMELPHAVLILGDMFELGESAAQEHQDIADLATELGFQNAFLIGENFFGTNSSYLKFKSFDDFNRYLEKVPLRGGNLLVKGSRGMALERILDLL